MDQQPCQKELFDEIDELVGQGLHDLVLCFADAVRNLTRHDLFEDALLVAEIVKEH